MPFDTTGLGDLERLDVAGHSRGGPIAVRHLTDENAGHTPVALALITPAYIVDAESPAAVPDGMPVAVVVATCDGDIGAMQSRRYARHVLAPDRLGLTVVDTIAGGTHNAVSTSLAPDRAPDVAGMAGAQLGGALVSGESAGSSLASRDRSTRLLGTGTAPILVVGTTRDPAATVRGTCVASGILTVSA